MEQYINTYEMRGVIYSANKKEAVKKLILDGKSYNEITKILNVPKSTISTWFGKTLKKPMTRSAMLDHLASIRKLSAIKVKNKWKIIRDDENRFIEEKIKKEISAYPFDNIGFYKSMLSMLYWAEGSKSGSGLHFVNTDPELMKFFLKLLRRCYDIDEKKIRVRLHLHYYHKVKNTQNFWSNALDVPKNQFGKIYFKKRNKSKRFRKNFMGICFVYYGNTKIRKEILEITKALPKI